jgi:hypothetical protein
MPAMPRFQAMLVVVALIAAPLSLLARGIACDPSTCDCAASCAMHLSHSKPICGMAQHAPMCGTHQGHHALDYGFIAPFAPAAPLPHAQLARPLASQNFVVQFSQLSVDGVSPLPFEPPRS